MWKADLSYQYDKDTVFDGKKKILSSKLYSDILKHDQINRQVMDTEEKTSQAVTFSCGLEFIETNHGEDNWFLQIETFDPHEPFYTLKGDKDLYPHRFVGDAEADWPPYSPVKEDEETIWHVRYEYAALLSKCDRYLGKVLDIMDKYHMWKDTMLIVNTDHGFLLGEHGWWGKTAMPIYDEIAHTPLYVYDPRIKEYAGYKRYSLVQTIDIAPTLLEFFGLEIPKDMEGKPLRKIMENEEPIREYALFGYHGSQINVTDGRYVYMHSAVNPDNPVYEYTLMPTHMRRMFRPSELQELELAGPFTFSKGCKLLKIKAENRMGDTTEFGSKLFDLTENPNQSAEIRNEEVRQRMLSYISRYMKKNDAPEELYSRYGIDRQ